MENKVFLVIFSLDYDGSRVLSVHRSEAGAIKAAAATVAQSTLAGYEGGGRYWRNSSCGYDIEVESFDLED